MVYKVKNMSCKHCVKRIETALSEAGIEAVVNLENKTVTTDNSEALKVLDKIGYPVSE